jgi:hypothetical protein
MAVDPEAWRADAACRDRIDIDFFPGLGESTLPAKKVCETCLVRAACLEYALTNVEVFGVWGGTSERQRRLMRRARRAEAGITKGLRPGYVPAKQAEHGTTSGYMKHRREGTTPCAECRAARNAYEKANRLAREARQADGEGAA